MKEYRCVNCNSKMLEYVGNGDFVIKIKCRKCNCKLINILEFKNNKLTNVYMKGGEKQ